MSTSIVLPPVKILQQVLESNGEFPNNPHLPVLLYKDVLQLTGPEDVSAVKAVFLKNNWRNTWVNGIYSYHHYHSNTHEVIGIINGRCTVVLGGNGGIVCKLTKGDVLLIPAGVAHKSLDFSGDFRCMGAYPEGKNYDMNYGLPTEHPAVDNNIKNVPLPATDPVYGRQGPLQACWREGCDEG